MAIWLCIIELVPHQVRVHLEEPTTFDAMSTPALSGSMVLFVSAGHAEGSGGRSPNCLWNKKKKKKRCWPSAKLATLSRQRISGYWVDPCCVSLPGGKWSALLSCLQQLIKGTNVAGMQRDSASFAAAAAANVLNDNQQPEVSQN